MPSATMSKQRMPFAPSRRRSVALLATLDLLVLVIVGLLARSAF